MSFINCGHNFLLIVELIELIAGGQESYDPFVLHTLCVEISVRTVPGCFPRISELVRESYLCPLLFCLVSLKCESSRDLHSAEWADYEEIEDNLNLSILSLVTYNKRGFLELRLLVNCNARVGSSYFKSHLGSSFIPLPISIRPYLNWHARESVFVSSPFSPGQWALGSNANDITHRQLHCEFKIGFI